MVRIQPFSLMNLPFYVLSRSPLRKAERPVTYRPELAPAPKTQVSGCVTLNFKRNKFFPYIHGESGDGGIFFNSSLGLVCSLSQQGSTSKKSKTAYLSTSRLIRRVIIHSRCHNYNLKLKGSPKYISEIMSAMYARSTPIYANPSNALGHYDESSLGPRGIILAGTLTLSSPFSYYKRKLKSRGRLKRKISKRLVASNRVID